MKTDKRVTEYNDKYKNIPDGFTERYNWLIKELKMKPAEIKTLNSMVNSIVHAESEKLQFVIYLKPQPTARPRVTRWSVFVPHSKENLELFRNFLVQMEKEIKKQVNTIVTPVKMDITCYIETPKSMKRIEKIIVELGLDYPISTPDWDNLGKTYSDMIKGSLLLDDSIIVKSTVEKRYSVKPRIEIKLEYMKKFNTDFNLKRIESWKSFKELALKPDYYR